MSKTKPNAAIIEALNAGHKHFGENRMQELHTKMKTINDPKIQWHMIGGIQSNKIKYITSHVHWIHSIDKTKYINEVNKRAEQEARTINLLIQVNISEEHQKNGCNLLNWKEF